jgi:hypothetical protein
MLSVSDAFALVTLRLGKLETMVNKWQNEGFQSAYDESSIVQAVLARIDNRQQPDKMYHVERRNGPPLTTKRDYHHGII